MDKQEDLLYAPKEGFILAHFLTVSDIKRSSEFYLRIFGGKIIRHGEPTIIQIAHWVSMVRNASKIINPYSLGR